MHFWIDPAPYAARQPSVSYASLASGEASPSGLLPALELLAAHGVVFIDGVPPTTEATESLCRTLVGGRPLRETHYGQFWDFTADMSRGDLAYSNQALGAHTDGSYFVDPAGLQIFHLLAHPPPGTGGESLLVDGFTCAAVFRAEHPADYAVLSRLKTPAVAAGSKGLLYHTSEGHPVFAHDQRGRLVGIRWNNEDRARMGGAAEGWAVEDVDAWYVAARRWEAVVRRPEHQVWVKLQPGTTVGASSSCAATCS
jgi:trimethyllysine dioxygenase